MLPGVWATITVRQAFFDTLGMGAVYHRHYTTERDLFIGTAVALVLLGVPLLLAALRVAGVPDRDGSQVPHARRAVWSVWIVLGAVSALTFGRTMLSKGDDYLAATNAVSFGRTYAGHDVAYYVFQLPLIVSVLRLAAFVLVLLAIASGTVYAVAEQRRRGSLVHAGDARRAGNLVVGVTFVYGGLALVCLGLAFYLDRNSALVGGDDLISGADKATRVVGMPSQAVIGAMIMLLGVATCALALGRLRRHLFLTTFRMAAVAGGVWIGTALVLTVLVTAWWAVLLLIAIAVTFVLLRLSRPSTEDHPNLATAHGQLRRGKVDGWPDRAAWAAFVVVTAIVGGAAPAAGASLYDHFTLSGPRYQNQRSYIERSIESTRYGFNLDRMRLQDAAGYRQNGVTTEAIAAAPASVASLRFLSLNTIQPACELTQAIDQFYNCGAAHIDRYTFGNDRRTMFVMPRLVDWSRVTGFQRQHFAYTSGCGLVMSPVNETDPTGKPLYTVSGIPQLGVELPKQELYFGDDRAPWAMVDTTQNQFDCLKNRVITWGGKGLRVGDHRLALALFLGGLPYIGGGRQFWNSTDGNPAGADSQVLLYRGIRTRLERLAPFLEWDSQPYYVAADGHAYVDRRRVRHHRPAAVLRAVRRASATCAATVLGVMDAYSGATKLYVAAAEGADHRHLDEGLPVAVHAARAAAGRPQGARQVRRRRVRRAGGGTGAVSRHVRRDVLQRGSGVGLHRGDHRRRHPGPARHQSIAVQLPRAPRRHDRAVRRRALLQAGRAGEGDRLLGLAGDRLGTGPLRAGDGAAVPADGRGCQAADLARHVHVERRPRPEPVAADHDARHVGVAGRHAGGADR